jgi:predicted transcriptional regulator
MVLTYRDDVVSLFHSRFTGTQMICPVLHVTKDIMSESRSSLLTLTAQIVGSHAANNQVGHHDLLRMIKSVYGVLARVTERDAAPVSHEPAVPASRSVFPTHIICLEDGRQLKTLKRHLMVAYGLTPEQYRTKWGLPLDYPMVAPEYGALRSAMAKSVGLGRKRSMPIKAEVPVQRFLEGARGGTAVRMPTGDGAPRRRGRPPKQTAAS